MSGGSFDYLGLRVRPLGEQRDALERMAAKLVEIEGADEAAAATARVLELLGEAESLADTLAEAWYAVEWWWSGDWSYEQMIEDVAKYRAPDTEAATVEKADPQVAIDFAAQLGLPVPEVDHG